MLPALFSSFECLLIANFPLDSSFRHTTQWAKAELLLETALEDSVGPF